MKTFVKAEMQVEPPKWGDFDRLELLTLLAEVGRNEILEVDVEPDDADAEDCAYYRVQGVRDSGNSTTRTALKIFDNPSSALLYMIVRARPDDILNKLIDTLERLQNIATTAANLIEDSAPHEAALFRGDEVTAKRVLGALKKELSL